MRKEGDWMPETIPLWNCGAPPTLHQGEVHVHCKITQQINKFVKKSLTLLFTFPDDSSLSTAAIIGISAAGLVAILVVIGTVVYWKKYHHRSRLRAAYYNDISMHDPLYEDFGPEVA